MSDYISREAVMDVFMRYGIGWGNAKVKGVINSIPAADVVPVVLCKDCRHRDPEDHKCDSGQLERAGCVFPVDDDYFCAYGER